MDLGILNDAAKGLGSVAYVVVDTLGDVKAKSITTIFNVKNFWQRATRGYSDSDVWNLGYSEEERIGKMLSDLAYTVHGYPDGYDDPERWLEKRDPEEYAKEQNLYLGLMRGNDYCKKTEKGYLSPMTNEDIGIGYAAWVDDIVYASEVIEMHLKMQNDYNDYGKVFGREDYNEHMKTMDEEFKRVWKWLGDNWCSLWD